MPNLETSTDIDAFMGSANQAEARVALGLPEIFESKLDAGAGQVLLDYDSTYNVTELDRGKTFVCNGNFILSLPTAINGMRIFVNLSEAGECTLSGADVFNEWSTLDFASSITTDMGICVIEAQEGLWILKRGVAARFCNDLIKIHEQSLEFDGNHAPYTPGSVLVSNAIVDISSSNVSFKNCPEVAFVQGSRVIFDAVVMDSSRVRSGAGSLPITAPVCKLTSTAASQVITLDNGEDGQKLTIVHAVDGGSMVLTPETKTGWTTATFTSLADLVVLQYFEETGWVILSSRGATIL